MDKSIARSFDCTLYLISEFFEFSQSAVVEIKEDDMSNMLSCAIVSYHISVIMYRTFSYDTCVK